MNILDLVRKNVERKIGIMQTSLKEARIAQLNAPPATESHSDTTKSEMEKLVTALEIDIGREKSYLSAVPKDVVLSDPIVGIWREVKINNKGTMMDMVIVSDGMGGDVVEGVRLVSQTTPLVSMIIGKSEGDKIKVEGGEIEVLEVR